MELYQDAHRIFRDLAEHGIGEADAIPAGLLATLDQYHYLGTEATPAPPAPPARVRFAAARGAAAHPRAAVPPCAALSGAGHEPLDEFIERAGLTPASRVLEVGSGIGGPSRYVAAAAGCAVRALELQDDLNAIGERLTRRCGLARLVTHACGDILGEPAPAGGEAFDALLSVLCFLHVPDKRALFAACRAQLRPDGVMFVEDFVARRPVDASDLTRLKEHVFCTSVPTVEEYTAQLQAAGFGDIKVRDALTGAVSSS